MTKKSVKSQLLRNKQAANRSRKMIRQVFKKPVKRTEVYRVWDAYLEWFYAELMTGKEVNAMANVGSFIVEKEMVSDNLRKLRNQGVGIKNGFRYPLKNININNMDYVFKVKYNRGKSIVDGVKFIPCKALKKRLFDTIVKGKDFRECRLIN